jgi:hypothetical protein
MIAVEHCTLNPGALRTLAILIKKLSMRPLAVKAEALDAKN